MLASKYKIEEKISDGSFGSVFSGTNIRTGEQVAIKVEKKDSLMKTLKHEARVYQYLNGQLGFCKLKWFGTNNKVNYLVLDLLGQSLTNIVETNGPLPTKTAAALCIQMVQRLETLHSMNLLHRDIKPDNFLLGQGNNETRLYLIDFSFSKRFIDDAGNHIKKGTISKIIGSPNWVSLNIHNGLEPSRRDDLTSVIYILFYLLKGAVPWQQVADLGAMIRLKMGFINGAPYVVQHLLGCVNNMEFDSEPDYRHIINVLSSLIS